MSLGSVIKENRVFVAGILLPVVLIALLSLAKNLPLVDPPTQQVVFWTKGYSDRGTLTARVTDDHHLDVIYTKNKDFKPQTNYAGSPATATIYVYNAANGTVRNIDIKADQTNEAENNQKISLPELADVQLSKETMSKDGYSFEPYIYNRNSLITDIFGYNSGSGPALTKSGHIVRIAPATGYYYGGSPEFIGWVTGGDVK